MSDSGLSLSPLFCLCKALHTRVLGHHTQITSFGSIFKDCWDRLPNFKVGVDRGQNDQKIEKGRKNKNASQPCRTSNLSADQSPHLILIVRGVPQTFYPCLSKFIPISIQSDITVIQPNLLQSDWL